MPGGGSIDEKPATVWSVSGYCLASVQESDPDVQE